MRKPLLALPPPLSRWSLYEEGYPRTTFLDDNSRTIRSGRPYSLSLDPIPERAVRFAPDDAGSVVVSLSLEQRDDHPSTDSETQDEQTSPIDGCHNDDLWYSQEELAALRVETGLNLRQYLQRQTAAALAVLNSHRSNSSTTTGSHGRSITITCPNRTGRLANATTAATTVSTTPSARTDCHDDSNDDWCPRGLEYVLEGRPREKIRRQHILKVLQHYRQSLTPAAPKSPLTTAELSKASSMANGSLRRARSLALIDTKEAQRIHAEVAPKRTPSSSSGSAKRAVVRIRGSGPVMAAGCA